jgi:hypothetical protein
MGFWRGTGRCTFEPVGPSAPSGLSISRRARILHAIFHAALHGQLTSGADTAHVDGGARDGWPAAQRPSGENTSRGGSMKTSSAHTANTEVLTCSQRPREPCGIRRCPAGAEDGLHQRNYDRAALSDIAQDVPRRAVTGPEKLQSVRPSASAPAETVDGPRARGREFVYGHGLLPLRVPPGKASNGRWAAWPSTSSGSRRPPQGPHADRRPVSRGRGGRTGGPGPAGIPPSQAKAQRGIAKPPKRRNAWRQW